MASVRRRRERLLCTPAARSSPTARSAASDGTAQLADGLDALKQTLNADVLPLLNGDVQKAFDVFENSKNQLAAEVSFDLIDDGMAHDMVYIIRTDLNNKVIGQNAARFETPGGIFALKAQIRRFSN